MWKHDVSPQSIGSGVWTKANKRHVFTDVSLTHSLPSGTFHFFARTARCALSSGDAGTPPWAPPAAAVEQMRRVKELQRDGLPATSGEVHLAKSQGLKARPWPDTSQHHQSSTDMCRPCNRRACLPCKVRCSSRNWAVRPSNRVSVLLFCSLNGRKSISSLGHKSGCS